MTKIPTDRMVLQEIYDRYYEDFAAYSKTKPTRESKILVPIDLEAIANHFNVDVDLIFGRLYSHLQHQYGYELSNGAKMAFFTVAVGKDRHCVNMPLLAAVLAGMQEEHGRYVWTHRLAIAAFIVSIFALAVSWLKP
jgi:hypothetical protein